MRYIEAPFPTFSRVKFVDRKPVGLCRASPCQSREVADMFTVNFTKPGIDRRAISAPPPQWKDRSGDATPAGRVPGPRTSRKLGVSASLAFGDAYLGCPTWKVVSDGWWGMDQLWVPTPASL